MCLKIEVTTGNLMNVSPLRTGYAHIAKGKCFGPGVLEVHSKMCGYLDPEASKYPLSFWVYSQNSIRSPYSWEESRGRCVKVQWCNAGKGKGLPFGKTHYDQFQYIL